MTLRLNRLWRPLRRLLADFIQPETALLLVPITTGGDPAVLQLPQQSWRPQGRIEVIRLKTTDVPADAPVGAGDPATASVWVTLDAVPVGARLVTDAATWQVVQVRRNGPRGLVTKLICLPVPGALEEAEL